ncbi:MAG: tandem-95 repeat protein, partial [Acidimicrobiia bacterium]|nr:tandem-95 repeat protein [Acidimicrobiia bacterium]
TIGSTPTLGVIVPGGLPTVTYLPNVDADGSDTFTYTVTDGDLVSAPAVVTFGIGANGAPIAAPDVFDIEQNDTLTIEAPGVLGNDLDPDGAELTAILTAPPTYGTLTLNDDGSFTYTHDGPHGVEDTFTYTAFDGIRTSEPIDVTIDVAPNLNPVAVDDEVEINEDTIASLLPLLNDFDPDGDPIAITGYEGVANGTVTVGPNGFVYTPEPNWHGVEVFTYTIQDDRGGAATASITIRVAAGNDAPVAPDINLAMGPGSDPALINPLGVASDPDGDSLDFVLGSPEHGVLGLGANGRVYTPEAGFNGTDVFTYSVTDPFGARANGTITITVTTPALEDIGLNLVEFGPPEQAGESTGAATDLGLPGMRLLVGSVFDTFDSFRLPVLVLALAFGLSLILGLSGTFILGSGPVFLAAVAPGRVAVVVAASGERIPVRDEPGDKNDVIHYLEPGERNLHATGRRAQVDGEIWTEIETDDGRGWVTASFLTRQVSDMRFGGADEPGELLKVLNTVLGTSGNLGLIAGDRGLAVAHFAPPETFPTEDLPDLLGSEKVWAWWGRTGSIQDEDGTFAEIVAAPLLETMARYEARNEPAASAPIPIELVNYQSMVYADPTIPGKDAWRVFFELDHDDNWTIAAIWREALPNPNAGTGTRRLISA